MRSNLERMLNAIVIVLLFVSAALTMIVVWFGDNLYAIAPVYIFTFLVLFLWANVWRSEQTY